jgi:hypothetical protein
MIYLSRESAAIAASISTRMMANHFRRHSRTPTGKYRRDFPTRIKFCDSFVISLLPLDNISSGWSLDRQQQQTFDEKGSFGVI